jgi:hypothetical protein
MYEKYIPPDYREGGLNKGESVCLDRCVGKFFEVNMKVSEKMQGEAAGRQTGGEWVLECEEWFKWRLVHGVGYFRCTAWV